MKKLILLMILSLMICNGCAGKPTSRFGSEPNLNSKADAAAYAAEGFSFSKDMPIHGTSPDQFYFKICNPDNGKVYYSKTSYDCTVLPFER